MITSIITIISSLHQVFFNIKSLLVFLSILLFPLLATTQSCLKDYKENFLMTGYDL